MILFYSLEPYQVLADYWNSMQLLDDDHDDQNDVKNDEHDDYDDDNCSTHHLKTMKLYIF